MALDFPASPTNGQIFTGGGATWMWDGTKWVNGASATAYAPIASPAFTGNPTGPTPPPGDNDTSLATTAFVMAATGGVGGGATIAAAPPALNPGALWWDSIGGRLYVRYDDGNTVQYVPATNIAGLASAAASLNNVGRNLIHNPLFNVAQRGLGPFTTNVFTIDRWRINFGGTGATYTQNQVAAADSDRASIGDEAARYILQNEFVGGIDAAAYTVVQQAIEGVRRLSGKTVTLSFWATQSVGSPSRIGASINQIFGTGGAPSANVPGNGQSATLPGSAGTWQRYSFTFTLPSTAGKTPGTNGDDYTQLQIWLSAGASNAASSGGVGTQSGTIWLWGVQLEIGSVATPLEKPDPRYDLSKCLRFYQTGAVYIEGYNNTGGALSYQVPFMGPMRAVPVMQLANQAYVNASGATATNANFTGFAFRALVTATGAAVASALFNASADL